MTEGEVDQLIITPSVDRQPKDGKNWPRERLGIVGWFLHDVGGFIGEFKSPDLAMSSDSSLPLPPVV